MNKYENVMVNVMIKMHFSLPITKALSAMPASPCEAKSCGEPILASPMTKKKASKANPNAFQPKRANFLG